ncbi:MAG: exo-alpha-sialidase [Nitrosarchaeum sp.]|nr:MAG: exo-alpha-sialidase [Nitrosarchaeum sp.]
MLKYFLIFFVIFTGLAILPAHAITDFTPFQNISNSPNDSVNPFVVTDGKNIFIAWTEFSKGNHAGDVLFSKSTDGGETFSVPQNISNQQGSSIAPFIRVDGTSIFVTWTYRYQEDHYSEIFFSKSIDGGTTFSTPQKISGSTFSYGSRLATDDMNIFVTWGDITYSDNRYENMEILFSKSTDGGTTFSTPMNLSNNDGFSSYPSIAIDGKNVFIAWQDYSVVDTDIFVSESTDGGVTFSTPLNISTSPDGSVGARIIADGKNIFVTWFEFSKGIGDIFFSKSIDSGATFSTPMNLSKNKENSIVPFMVTDGKDIFITWTDATTTGSWIVFSKSTDGGATFSTQKISNDKGFSDAQSIATDGKTVFTAWNYHLKMELPYDILFSKSTNLDPSHDPAITEQSNPQQYSIQVKDSLNIDSKTINNDMQTKYLSPRKQLESGIQPDEITCKEGLELVIKTDHRHHPLCVTPDTKSKMIQRGLAMLIQTAN